MIDLSLMVQALDDMIFLLDETFVFRQYWAAQEKLLWKTPQEFIGKTVQEMFPEGMALIALEEKIEQVLATGNNEKIVWQIPKKHGAEQWLRVKLHLVGQRDEADKRLLLIVIGDCTEEVTRQREQHLFQSFVNQNWEAIRYSDMDLTIRYVNPATCQLYGYAAGELIGKKVNLLTADSNMDVETVKQIIMKEGSWTGEMWQVRKDNTRFEGYLSVQLIYDDQGCPMGFVSQSKDISKRKETASKLKTIIAERETLLREIHHRVKNNLQVVTSLLSLQSSTLDDERIRQVFQQSQYRINAMATIHETLYRSNNFVGIDYHQYLITLSNYLLLSMKGQHHQVSLNINVPPVMLSLDTAIPLGLLVNEIITNALKYGIVGQVKGQLTIRLTPKQGQEYELYIGDNGVGYSTAINFDNTTSLGLKLVKNLAHQINGSIERLSTEKGTYYRLSFLGILDETPIQTATQPVYKV